MEIFYKNLSTNTYIVFPIKFYVQVWLPSSCKLQIKFFHFYFFWCVFCLQLNFQLLYQLLFQRIEDSYFRNFLSGWESYRLQLNLKSALRHLRWIWIKKFLSKFYRSLTFLLFNPTQHDSKVDIFVFLSECFIQSLNMLINLVPKVYCLSLNRKCALISDKKNFA